MGGQRVGALLAGGIALGLALGLGSPVHAGEPPTTDRGRPAAESERAKPAKAPRPVVTKVRPASGPATGGTVVTIKGKRLAKVTKVLFGRTKGTSVRVKSKRKLTVVAPPHAAGKVPVRVVAKAGRSKKSRKARFTYVRVAPVLGVPVVTGLSPDSGSVAGGTVVDISGTGLAGATAVSFGGTPATFTVLSSTAVRATSPAHAAGPVPVTVTTAGGTSAPSTYTYESSSTSPPVVLTVLPATGPAAGGTEVTITGSGFTGASAVSFDGTDATAFTVDSDTQITATTPAHAAGPVPVSVTTPAGTPAVPGLFTYLPLSSVPLVALVTPPLGPPAGGTEVTLSGSGFTGATAVTFGGVPATFVVDSDLQITATSPAHAPGLASVLVTTPAGTSPVPGLFTYFSLP